ncbi:MAG: M48 family metallopeptidase [Gammaproteobacteria bacterium]
MKAPAAQQAFDFDAVATGAPATSPRWTVDVRRSRRRSLSVEVHADLRVIARAPLHCPEAAITAFIASREAWIARQLEHFAHRPPVLEARYADGETHWFLGEPLQLRLAPQARHVIARRPGVLEVGGARVADAARTARAVQHWFREQARIVFGELLLQWQAHPRFARYPVPALKIRLMRTRWGSFSPRTGMTLNLVLIHAPRPAIEYVVVHELCHHRYRGHGKGFYALMDAVLPDWRARKRLLEAGIAALAPTR